MSVLAEPVLYYIMHKAGFFTMKYDCYKKGNKTIHLNNVFYIKHYF